MKLKTITNEAKLLLIGIPVLIWTLLPIYHLALFAFSPKDEGTTGKLWPDHPTLQNFEIAFNRKHFYLNHFWDQIFNSLVIAISGCLDPLYRHLRGLCHQPPEGARGSHGHEHGLVHLLHSRGVFGGAHV